jgi:hypothetical protein
LPRWPGRSFLIKGVTGAKSVALLGAATPLKFSTSERGVEVTLPDIPLNLLEQPAWVLKVNQ